MSNLSLQELIFLFKIVIYFMGIIGTIIIIVGSIISYFFKSDRKQNRDEHKDLFDKAESQGNEIAKIKGSLGID